MQTGYRKVWIISVYMLGCFGITFLEILNKPDAGAIAALGGTFLGIATGVGTFMWGNAQEHKHSNDQKTP
jgi:hypothetical protein